MTISEQHDRLLIRVAYRLWRWRRVKLTDIVDKYALAKDLESIGSLVSTGELEEKIVDDFFEADILKRFIREFAENVYHSDQT